MPQIKIVYYVYLNEASNWKTVISGQLNQLKNYGILNEADLYVHITDCFGLAKEASQLVRSIESNAIISCNNKNQYEYPGIKLVYDLAILHPTNIFAYFHTKGMSHNLNKRSAFEVEIFTQTFRNWRKNIGFLNKKGISKVGLFPAIWLDKPAEYGGIGGWIFYNFWYASGAYVAICETPKPNMDRYYYEGWLGRAYGREPIISNDCKSIFKIPFITKNYFTGKEADFFLNFSLNINLTFVGRILRLINCRWLAYWYLKLK